MAIPKRKVFLGFEDELITEKYCSFVNYTTNKVGGKPDWPKDMKLQNPLCELCGLTLPFIVQIYAPLLKSPFHRTLYIFGCVNPKCWNENKSWVCLRSQCSDTEPEKSIQNQESLNNFEWCEDANTWDEQENENYIGEINPEQSSFQESVTLNQNISEMILDNTEEAFAAMSVSDPPTLRATAVIEEGEDAITIDTPCVAQINVPALMDQAKEIPQVLSHELQFVSFFITVCEEDQSQYVPNDLDLDVACRQESNSIAQPTLTSVGDVGTVELTEKYEKALPLHGDKFCHNFISRIQRNPGQLLRYIREGASPLFLYPLGNIPKYCQHCNGDLVFELQLLPTLISRLLLVGSGTGHIEYGTVFILACERSCWQEKDTVRTEYVIVQREI